MNKKEFVKLIDDPSLLSTSADNVLNELITQYPYFQNLHVLKAQQSKLRQHPHFYLHLQTASFYTPDREHLYHIFHPEAVWQKPILHSIHEVKKVENSIATPVFDVDLEQEEVPVFEYQRTILDDSPAIRFFEPTDDDSIKQEQHGNQLSNDSEDEDMRFNNLLLEEQIQLSPEVDLFVNKFMSLAGDEPIEDETPKATSTPIAAVEEAEWTAPTPKQNFKSWLESLKQPSMKIFSPETMAVPDAIEASTHSEEKEVAAIPKATGESAKPLRAKKIKINSDSKKAKSKQLKTSDNSLKDKEEVFSEALADLLAKQGHNDKAIGMYEKLILVFPEKMPIFAAKIEKLKI